METTHGTTSDALVELHRQAEYMNVPPWNTPPKKHADALKAVEAGRVSQVSDTRWLVQGSKGNFYAVTHAGCDCPHAQHNTTTKFACYHAVAVELYRRWQRELPRDLFAAPKTVDARLAESHQDAPDDEIDFPEDMRPMETPETLLEPPGAPEAAQTMVPQPAPALALPLRSISAIIADLSRPLPASCVATKTQGGETIPFLHWQTVARLLDTYAPGWHGTVSRIDQVRDTCVMTYRLTIPCLEGEVAREATGQEDEDVKGYGDASSNAEAMAFKRAAAKFGVSWLYDRRGDTTAPALVAHLKEERTAALAELGKAVDEAGMAREAVIDWLRKQTGAQRNSEIPLWAIRTLVGHLSTQGVPPGLLRERSSSREELR